jgi:hypothetical protein
MAAGSLEDVKTVSDVASNVITIAAAIAAAIGTYWAFFRERTRWPKANLELVLSHRRLNSKKVLLHAKVKVHNAGRGLMKLTRIRVDVYQVRPLLPETEAGLNDGTLKPYGSSRARWERIDRETLLWGEASSAPAPEPEPELEPGENDEFGCDFIVPASLETVRVYVYVLNVAKRRREGNLGWSVTNYYDLGGSSGAESAANVVVSEPAGSALGREDVHG